MVAVSRFGRYRRWKTIATIAIGFTVCGEVDGERSTADSSIALAPVRRFLYGAQRHNRRPTMLIAVHTQKMLAEAATAASIAACRATLDNGRRPGHVRALAERRAR